MTDIPVDADALAWFSLIALQGACFVIIVLFRRTLSQFDKHNDVQDRRLNSHSDTLGRIDKHMARVEEYMDNAKASRDERSRQMDAFGRKIDSILQGRGVQ